MWWNFEFLRLSDKILKYAFDNLYDLLSSSYCEVLVRIATRGGIRQCWVHWRIGCCPKPSTPGTCQSIHFCRWAKWLQHCHQGQLQRAPWQTGPDGRPCLHPVQKPYWNVPFLGPFSRTAPGDGAYVLHALVVWCTENLDGNSDVSQKIRLKDLRTVN